MDRVLRRPHLRGRPRLPLDVEERAPRPPLPLRRRRPRRGRPQGRAGVRAVGGLVRVQAGAPPVAAAERVRRAREGRRIRAGRLPAADLGAAVSRARRPRGGEARPRVRGLRPLHRRARHQLAGGHLLPVERRIPRIVSNILPGNH